MPQPRFSRCVQYKGTRFRRLPYPTRLLPVPWRQSAYSGLSGVASGDVLKTISGVKGVATNAASMVSGGVATVTGAISSVAAAANTGPGGRSATSSRTQVCLSRDAGARLILNAPCSCAGGGAARNCSCRHARCGAAVSWRLRWSAHRLSHQAARRLSRRHRCWGGEGGGSGSRRCRCVAC